MILLYDLGSALLGALVANPLPAFLVAATVAIGVALVARRRGWVGRVRRHPRATAAILVPILAVAVPVGWYLTSPLVLSAALDEPAPLVATARSLPPAMSPTPTSASALASAFPSAAPASGSPLATTAPPARALLDRSGAFHGSDDFHFGRGTARLIEVAPGSYVVRLERFAVRNGPDLYVYLSPSADGYAEGAIELGPLKADTGNQNYPVPAGALGDPDDAASVVIWCRQFSHLFATAPLAA